MAPSVTAPSATGLRERKKLATRATIARVALELFDRDGFERTTLPAIAEAADVSPRTVSAYFPVKEDLLFPDSPATLGRLTTRLEQRRPEETTADAMRAWFQEELPEWEARSDDEARRRRVIASDEQLQHHERRLMVQAEGLLARAIAADLGQTADALEPRMVAAALLATFHVLGADRDAAIAGDRALSPGEALPALDRALLFVGAGVRALQEPGALTSGR